MNPFYWFARSLVRFILQIYFKDIKLEGTDRIDREKPLLISVNHPNSFLEAIVLACYLDFPLHFMVRADVFHPWFKWFFNWTNQIPVFRMKDGISKLKNNHSTFEYCSDKLNDGARIIIFSEANTLWCKNLRQLSNGTARIALETLEKYPNLPLQIVPIGVNFENVFVFRSNIWIKHEKSIDLKSFSNPSKRDITQEIRKQLEPAVIDIDSVPIPHFDTFAEIRGAFEKSFPSMQFEIAEHLGVFESKEVEEPLSALANFRHKNGLNLAPPYRKKPNVIKWIFYGLFYFIYWVVLGWILQCAGFFAKKIYNEAEFVIPIQLALSAVIVIIMSMTFIGMAVFIHWSALGIFLLWALIYCLPHFFIDGFLSEQYKFRYNKYVSPKINQYIQTLEKLNN